MDRAAAVTRGTFARKTRPAVRRAVSILNEQLAGKGVRVSRSPVLVRIGRDGRGWIESLVVLDRKGQAWMYGSWSRLRPWSNSATRPSNMTIYEQE